MFKLGQALNAGQSPSTDIISNPTNTVSSESGRWMEYLMMTLLSLFGVNLRVDTFNHVSCLSKSASLQANEIACSGQLNGSHMNLLMGQVCTNGGRFRSSRLTVEVQDEWIAMMRQHEPAIVLHKSR
jgi:hypothetical protein